ncbi:MAG TPA: ABC transporter permease [Burkholderiales bacterium]|nr:ABC transporter permease [Burkholderiales bacterium]
MSIVSLLGAIEAGFIYSLVALGIFLTFRVLSFPDLTVDGSFPFGAAITAVLIVKGWNPYLATTAAIAGGCMAGLVTAYLNIRLRVLNLLASILTMIALYSVNIRLMEGPMVPLLGQATVLDSVAGLGIPYPWLAPAYFLVVAAIAWALYTWFLHSETGLALRATGANPVMARANGVRTQRLVLLGLAIANGMTGLAGSLFAQLQGAADASMGIGTIIIGLAAVIGGAAVLPVRSLVGLTLACVLGSVVYHVIVALALNATTLGLTASDVNIVTAALVCVALMFGGRATALGARAQGKAT